MHGTIKSGQHKRRRESQKRARTEFEFGRHGRKEREIVGAQIQQQTTSSTAIMIGFHQLARMNTCQLSTFKTSTPSSLSDALTSLLHGPMVHGVDRAQRHDRGRRR